MTTNILQEFLQELVLATQTASGENLANAVRWGMICIEQDLVISRTQMEMLVAEQLKQATTTTILDCDKRFARVTADIVLQSIWQFHAANQLRQNQQKRYVRSDPTPENLVATAAPCIPVVQAQSTQ